MKIMLAPGETLTVGFYDEDFEVDGDFTVSFLENSIKIETTWPDASGREGVIYEEKFSQENLEKIVQQSSHDDDIREAFEAFGVEYERQDLTKYIIAHLADLADTPLENVSENTSPDDVNVVAEELDSLFEEIALIVDVTASDLHSKFGVKSTIAEIVNFIFESDRLSLKSVDSSIG